MQHIVEFQRERIFKQTQRASQFFLAPWIRRLCFRKQTLYTKMNSPTPQRSNRQKKARRLLLAQVLAGFSQWIDIFLIFSIPSFIWKSSPEEIAFIATCFGLPSLLLGPFVGVVVDRTDARKMALCGSLTRSVLTIAIAFAPTLPIFSAFVLLKGMANLLYWPATSILTNQIIDGPNRIKYYSSLRGLDQLTKIITPLMTGLLIAAVDSQKIFIISGAITFLCALVIFGLPSDPPKESAQEDQENKNTIWSDFLIGFRSIKVLHKHLLVSLSLGIGMSFALALHDPHLAAFLKYSNSPPSAFSIILSATAAGAAAGAIAVRFFFTRLASASLIRVGIFLFFLSLSIFSISISIEAKTLDVLPLAILWFMSGLGYELFLIGSSVNTQNLCPSHLLGRLTTSTRSVQMLAIVTAPSIGAALINHYTRLAPFTTSAVIAMFLLAGSFFMLPRSHISAAKNPA